MKDSVARLIIVLAIIAVGSGLVLSLTYNFTIPTINANAAEAQEEAIMEALPEAVTSEEIKDTDFPMYKGFDGAGNPAGVAYVVEGGGFQGIIKIMIGLDVENKVLTGLKILSHSETPGLGARITEDWFQEQFKGKSINDGFVAKEDVEAITGATISSKSVSKIVKDSVPRAMEQYQAVGGVE